VTVRIAQNRLGPMLEIKNDDTNERQRFASVGGPNLIRTKLAWRSFDAVCTRCLGQTVPVVTTEKVRIGRVRENQSIDMTVWTCPGSAGEGCGYALWEGTLPNGLPVGYVV
jgi:hypothetical protein